MASDSEIQTFESVDRWIAGGSLAPYTAFEPDKLGNALCRIVTANTPHLVTREMGDLVEQFGRGEATAVANVEKSRENFGVNGVGDFAAISQHGYLMGSVHLMPAKDTRGHINPKTLDVRAWGTPLTWRTDYKETGVAEMTSIYEEVLGVPLINEGDNPWSDYNYLRIMEPTDSPQLVHAAINAASSFPNQVPPTRRMSGTNASKIARRLSGLVVSRIEVYTAQIAHS